MNLTFSEGKLNSTRPLRLGTGLVAVDGEFPISDLLSHHQIDKLAVQPFGVIIQWRGSRKHRFGKVLALEDFCDFERFELKIKGAAFDDTRENYEESLAIAGQPDALTESFEAQKNYVHVGAGVVQRTVTIESEVALKTDEQRFIYQLRMLAARVMETGNAAPFPATPEERRQSPFLIVARRKDDGTVGFEVSLLMSIRFVLGIEQQPIRRFDFNIQFSDVAFLTQYPGLAALDIGNSGSTFAIKLLKDRNIGSIQLSYIDREYRRAAEGRRRPTLESAIYYQEIQPEDQVPEDRRLYPICRKVAGKAAILEAARRRDQRNLVMSPKRYLEREEYHPMPLKERSVSCHLPLKDLVAAILKEAQFDQGHLFHGGLGNQLPSITLTYPTTLMKPEIDRLENIYFAALDDVVCHQTKAGEPAADFVSPLKPEMLDEATAASFYFLDRDFFESAGRVAGFRYLYPAGANILVMDFGGGTTDLALVRCVARLSPVEPDDENARFARGGSRRDIVQMSVLGRTGLRRFGGDEITSAVYRVLKTSVAEKLSSGLGSFQPGTQSFLSWYEENAARIDEVIPTRTRAFTGDQSHRMLVDLPLNDVQRRQRQQLSAQFWQWAEEVKIWFSNTSEALPLPPGGCELHTLLHKDKAPAAAPKSVFGGRTRETREQHWTLSELPKLLESRLPLVNEQLERQLEILLKKANGLLADRLRQDPHSLETPVELHRAYIVGQAAHFSLIRECIAKNLNIELINHPERCREADWDSDADPDVRRLVFDRSELKHSVVKGALLFNSVRHTRSDVIFQGDEFLKDKLPFDILYDSYIEQKVRIYAEGEQFDHFVNKDRRLNFAIDPAKTGKSEAASIFHLYRRWPGDRDVVDPEEMIRFQLAPTMKGEVRIRCIEDELKGLSFELLIGEDDEYQSVIGQWVTAEDFESPLQRGDL